MNATPLLIEDAMPGHRLHLHDSTGYAPESFPDLVDIKTEALHHPPLIMLIQRDCRFSLAAEAATLTRKYLFDCIH
jgi:hypothetical protein